jgi:methylglutaconyl-CoA hydratase
MTGEVLMTTEDGICTISFHHPKGNSLPKELLAQLSNQIKIAGEEPTVKVILLKSIGKTFCAGASFDELLAIQSEADANEFFSGFGKLIEAIKDCPKFVIAEVQGKAVGGGVGIIAASDYAIASESASIKLSELSIGFGPFVIAPAVIRKIGSSAFSTLTINSKNWKTAEWALQKGLFNDLAKDHEMLESKTKELVQSLAVYSLEAMKEIKEMLWDGYDNLNEIHGKRAKLSGSLSQSALTQKILSQFNK